MVTFLPWKQYSCYLLIRWFIEESKLLPLKQYANVLLECACQTVFVPKNLGFYIVFLLFKQYRFFLLVFSHSLHICSEDQGPAWLWYYLSSWLYIKASPITPRRSTHIDLQNGYYVFSLSFPSIPFLHSYFILLQNFQQIYPLAVISSTRCSLSVLYHLGFSSIFTIFLVSIFTPSSLPSFNILRCSTSASSNNLRLFAFPSAHMIKEIPAMLISFLFFFPIFVVFRFALYYIQQ